MRQRLENRPGDSSSRRCSTDSTTSSLWLSVEESDAMRVNVIFISALVLLAGCTQVPLGPSVAVMPAPGKPFDLFVSEEALCRRYADQQVGISPHHVFKDTAVT